MLQQEKNVLNRERAKNVSIQLPESGFIFIIGNSGTGKSRIMQEIVWVLTHRKFSIYGFDLEYLSVVPNTIRRHAFKHYSERLDWFDIRDKVNEDIELGRDIIFDDATFYINDESFAILRPAFTDALKNRIFIITQQSISDLTNRHDVLAHFGGKEIQCYWTRNGGFQHTNDIGSMEK